MTKITFKDHFSSHSEDYKKFRPLYPPQLFEYLSKQCHQHDLAWDCATGSGQVATELANFFKQVIATDASDQQIKNNLPQENIAYRVAGAEDSSLNDHSVDLVTAAQALHWFDIDKFVIEVQRVLKPNGVLAVWSYNLLTIEKDIDDVINDFYVNILDDFWPPERKMVENAYTEIRFPFEIERSTSFNMQATWSLDHLLGYLSTWSAVKAYIKANNRDPIENLANNLLQLWGNKTDKKVIFWPLSVLLAHPNS